MWGRCAGGPSGTGYRDIPVPKSLCGTHICGVQGGKGVIRAGSAPTLHPTAQTNAPSAAPVAPTSRTTPAPIPPFNPPTPSWSPPTPWNPPPSAPPTSAGGEGDAPTAAPTEGGGGGTTAIVVAVLGILALGGAGFWYFRKVKKRQASGGGSGAQGSGGGRQAVELKSIAAEVNGDGDYMPPALPTGIGGDPAADAQQAAPTTDFVKMPVAVPRNTWLQRNRRALHSYGLDAHCR